MVFAGAVVAIDTRKPLTASPGEGFCGEGRIRALSASVGAV